MQRPLATVVIGGIKVMKVSVSFPAVWLGWENPERALTVCGDVFSPQCEAVEFLVANDCKVMVDAGIRLLSYANQLAASGREMVLKFSGVRSNAFTYLNRLGFFDFLDPRIVVVKDIPRTIVRLTWQPSPFTGRG